MIISPPFLRNRAASQSDADWTGAMMPVNTDMGFPLNGAESWHGGHITHTDKGNPNEKIRPRNPTALCGAGQEMYADIYLVEAKKSTRVQRIMVVSCWRSLELDSWQKQEDFSSITWNKDGVIFDWIVPPKFTSLRAQLNLNTVSPELIFIP